MDAPVFYYDFNSPFAYVAAHRVDDVLPVRPRWRPIALAFLLRAHDREPWSFDADTRTPTMRDCERRAAELGLPLVWPAGWPKQSYSLAPLRAAAVAERAGRLREYSRAAFRRHFGGTGSLADAETAIAAAADVGLDPEQVRAQLAADDVKRAVTDATQAAIELGVFGVPTVQVGDELFWGDDRLEEAAAALERATG
jgi:2-hydroxychromene-2-carboxylate isomerase